MRRTRVIPRNAFNTNFYSSFNYHRQLFCKSPERQIVQHKMYAQVQYINIKKPLYLLNDYQFKYIIKPPINRPNNTIDMNIFALANILESFKEKDSLENDIKNDVEVIAWRIAKKSCENIKKIQSSDAADPPVNFWTITLTTIRILYATVLLFGCIGSFIFIWYFDC